MKNGIAPSEDAVKQEKLVVELASGIKMMEMGMPAKISKENMGLVDYWNRELKENPCLIDAIESDVNNALDVIRKAERGEKIEYSSLKNEQQTTEMQAQMPKHYFVADEIAKHPDSEQKFVVIVRDKEDKSADVVLPAGASLEVNNEVSGMSKQRIEDVYKRQVLILSAKEGIQAQTKLLFNTLQKLQIPTIIFINKIDRDGVNLERL